MATASFCPLLTDSFDIEHKNWVKDLEMIPSRCLPKAPPNEAGVPGTLETTEAGSESTSAPSCMGEGFRPRH